MSTSWDAPAAVMSEVESGHRGVRALLDATAHASLTLSLSAPLAEGVDLAFAAMDLAEAREELDWVSSSDAEVVGPERLGPLAPTDDRAQALAVLVALVHVAVASIEKLPEPGAVSAGDDSLSRARRCCRSAAARLDSVCRR